MRKGIIILFILSFIFVSCERREDPTAVEQTIQEKDNGFVEAFNKKDVDGIMAPCWNSPDLITFYPDTTLRGYDALKDSWEKTFAMVDVKKFEITESHIEVGDHMAYDWGFWSYTFQPKEGPEVSMANGRYLQVWAHKDGQWVIVADHASVPFSPPPPPMATKNEKMRKKM
jgi:ketosteroid isomerase-like protein